MRFAQLLAMSAAAVALPVFAAAEAAEQQRAVGGPRITLPSHSNLFSWERGRDFHRGHDFGGFIVVERTFDYAQDREVPVIAKVEAPPPPTAAANSGTLNRDVPGLPRKPYVIGRHYASLPGGCMKMIEDGASFYYCGGGEWYRPVGKQYRAVRAP